MLPLGQIDIGARKSVFGGSDQSSRLTKILKFDRYDYTFWSAMFACNNEVFSNHV